MTFAAGGSPSYHVIGSALGPATPSTTCLILNHRSCAYQSRGYISSRCFSNSLSKVLGLIRQITRVTLISRVYLGDPISLEACACIRQVLSEAKGGFVSHIQPAYSSCSCLVGSCHCLNRQSFHLCIRVAQSRAVFRGALAP